SAALVRAVRRLSAANDGLISGHRRRGKERGLAPHAGKRQHHADRCRHRHRRQAGAAGAGATHRSTIAMSESPSPFEIELAVESLETPALTKAHLAEMLFEQIGLNKREAKDMVDAFFDLIVASLTRGEDVKLSN